MSDDRPTPWWAVAIPSFAAFILTALWALPEIAGAYGDDAIYLATGESLAQGRGWTVTVLPGHPEAAKYPPLFPLWVSLWARMVDLHTSAGLRTFLVAQALVWGVAVAVFLRTAVHTLVTPIWARVLLGLWLALCNLNLQLFSAPMSEGPYTLAVVVLSVCALRERAPWALHAAVHASASMLRQVHLVVGLAFAIALMVDRRWREAAAAAGGTVAGAAVTAALRASLPPRPVGDPLDYYTGYGGNFAYYTEAGAQLVPRLLEISRANLVAGLETASVLVLPTVDGNAILGTVFLVAAAVGLWGRGRALLWVLAAFFAVQVVWTWPFASRFWAPFGPILLAGAVASALSIPRIGSLLTGPVLVLVLAGHAIEPWFMIPARHAERPPSDHPYERQRAWVDQRLGQGDVLAGGPAVLHHAWRTRATGVSLDALLPGETQWRFVMGLTQPGASDEDVVLGRLEALAQQATGEMLLAFDGPVPEHWLGLIGRGTRDGLLLPEPEAPVPTWRVLPSHGPR